MWSSSRLVALWHFLVVHYCVVGVISGLFGDHWVRGCFERAMCLALYVLIPPFLILYSVFHY